MFFFLIFCSEHQCGKFLCVFKIICSENCDHTRDPPWCLYNMFFAVPGKGVLLINFFLEAMCLCTFSCNSNICIYFSSWQESGKQFCRTFEGAPQTWAQKSNLDYLSLDFNSASPSPVQKVCFKGITFVQFCTRRNFTYFIILLRTTFLWSSFRGKVPCVIYPILHTIIEGFIIEQLKNN